MTDEQKQLVDGEVFRLARRAELLSTSRFDGDKFDGQLLSRALVELADARRQLAKARQEARDKHNRLCIVEMALAAHRSRTGQETNARIEAMRRRLDEAMRKAESERAAGRADERRDAVAFAEQQSDKWSESGQLLYGSEAAYHSGRAEAYSDLRLDIEAGRHVGAGGKT